MYGGGGGIVTGSQNKIGRPTHGEHFQEINTKLRFVVNVSRVESGYSKLIAKS